MERCCCITLGLYGMGRSLAEEQHHDLKPLLALRQEAMALCRQAGWSPRHLGQQDAKPGVSEIYEELRWLQKARAVDLSQELIECSRKHQQWSPLFQDVEARIALFQGEVERAEEIWNRLVRHPRPVVQRIAKKAIFLLEQKKASGEQLVTDVLQALDRNQLDRAHSMLTDAVMDAKDLENAFLLDALASVALSRPHPAHWPWNRALLIDQLVIEMFDQQLACWEDHVG